MKGGKRREKGYFIIIAKTTLKNRKLANNPFIIRHNM